MTTTTTAPPILRPFRAVVRFVRRYPITTTATAATAAAYLTLCRL